MSSEKRENESNIGKNQIKRENDYLLEITKMNNQLLNTQRKLHKKNQELDRTIIELKKAMEEIKQLKKLLPICANCKKIRDSKGYWQNVETYISNHVDVQFSHGICNDCAMKLYPELFEEELEGKDNEKEKK